MKSFILFILGLFILGISCFGYYSMPDTNPGQIDTIKVDTILVDTIKKSMSFKDSVYYMMDKYEIHHQDIVYAQAVLETGHFKSKLCKKGNLFGLRGKKGYYHFNHWEESIKMYKEKIQSKYRKNEDYYQFLKRIHYAESSIYTKKLKQMIKYLKKHDN